MTLHAPHEGKEVSPAKCAFRPGSTKARCFSKSMPCMCLHVFAAPADQKFSALADGRRGGRARTGAVLAGHRALGGHADAPGRTAWRGPGRPHMSRPAPGFGVQGSPGGAPVPCGMRPELLPWLCGGSAGCGLAQRRRVSHIACMHEALAEWRWRSMLWFWHAD